MKHFKLNIEHNSIPVADLCITVLSEEDYTSVVKAFIHTLNDNHISFDYFIKEDQTIVAKKNEVSWSISE